MFDLHRSPVSSWEEYLVNPAPRLGVHDVDASPISAHPDVLMPDAETRARGVRM